MDTLYWFVGAILSTIVAAIVICVLAGIVIGGLGFRRRSPPMLIAGTLLAAAPFISHWWSGYSANEAYRNRVEEVGKLTRYPLPEDYPRTAIVLGGSAPTALKAYMVLGYLDEVRSEGDSMRGSIYRPISTSPECKAAALFVLQDDKNSSAANRTDFENLQQCWEVDDSGLSDPDLLGDAIIIRRDHEALNRAPTNTVWTNGIVEISVRVKDSETLIDYAEKPHMEKSQSPFLPLPKSLDTSGEPDPDLMIKRMFGSMKPIDPPDD